MKTSTLGWLVLAAIAAVWEALGLFHVGGLWPLTWDIWHAEEHHPTTIPFVAAILVWLFVHFLLQHKRQV